MHKKIAKRIAVDKLPPDKPVILGDTLASRARKRYKKSMRNPGKKGSPYWTQAHS